ncbi:hypothetical protein A1Q1_07779 [Trichosporon asahii var. asahii CBS 2479]|uniref:Uncharacterized protein n=1 Tax=Trichosporon asahii var. asahii (strain ATCC 90039 / CBS 2479 / JCM 2466 / KCTC 7840 / NBRC 103889/ NCYC 2677 / UAMH 7654) TaxID=1186058 RepID=J4UHG4_TRIAS|nr:hypothetical protein A1Q1_07779 [Trichosporon asahii var. asahii CBS 2479]EJT50985.1 hypothetical protein A1Q1_07779 [Trichosporon asahii var. asahii CBS 2479]
MAQTVWEDRTRHARQSQQRADHQGGRRRSVVVFSIVDCALSSTTARRPLSPTEHLISYTYPTLCLGVHNGVTYEQALEGAVPGPAALPSPPTIRTSPPTQMPIQTTHTRPDAPSPTHMSRNHHAEHIQEEPKNPAPRTRGSGQALPSRQPSTPRVSPPDSGPLVGRQSGPVPQIPPRSKEALCSLDASSKPSTRETDKLVGAKPLSRCIEPDPQRVPLPGMLHWPGSADRGIFRINWDDRRDPGTDAPPPLKLSTHPRNVSNDERRVLSPSGTVPDGSPTSPSLGPHGAWLDVHCVGQSSARRGLRKEQEERNAPRHAKRHIGSLGDVTSKVPTTPSFPSR